MGDNTDQSCTLCSIKATAGKYCSFSDAFAGSMGALKCLRQPGVDLAFVRWDDVVTSVRNGYTKESEVELLCPDKKGLDFNNLCHPCSFIVFFYFIL